MHQRITRAWLAVPFIIAGLSFTGCESTSAVRDDIPTIEMFCTEMSRTLCDLCGLPGDCMEEIATDCERNAATRDAGGYSAAKGSSCLAAIEPIDCSAPPLNCEGNLAIAACDAYLDGTSTVSCVAE